MSNEEQADTHNTSFPSVCKMNVLATGNSQMKHHVNQGGFHCYYKSIFMRSFIELKNKIMHNGRQQSEVCRNFFCFVLVVSLLGFFVLMYLNFILPKAFNEQLSSQQS